MSNWISVEDEFPPEGVEVIILTTWGKVTTDTYHNYGVVKGFLLYDEDGDVTHWTPLPLPPET